jgi:hypothetical protein
VQHHIEQDGNGGWKVALTPLQKEQLRKGIVLQVVKDAYPQSITRAALLRDSRLVEYSVRSVDRDLGDLVADGTISHTDKSPYKFVP